jgi:hypothetical protein
LASLGPPVKVDEEEDDEVDEEEDANVVVKIDEDVGFFSSRH